MMKTPLAELLGIQYPIIQGSMAHIATAQLAGAVSAAGGLGVISAGRRDPAEVQADIRKVREMTDKPFAVNVILENPNVKQHIDLLVSEQVPVVTTGGGTPAPYMPALLGAGCKVIPVIPHTRAAVKMQDAGAFAVVAEGRESGGHVGQMSTLPLIPQVCDAVQIPVIAAGGIADGRGFVAAMVLGAVGVQMGTAFLVAKECPIDPRYKQAVIRATDRDSVITGLGTIKEVRCIKNEFTEKYFALLKNNASPEEVEELLLGSLWRGVNGLPDGCYEAGQIQGLVKEEKTCAQIMADIMADAERVYNQYFQK